MTQRLKYLLALTGFCVCLPLIAEDPPQGTEEKPAVAEATRQTDSKRNESDSKRPAATEFDPSEDISEDLSVPFPVDI
ncbi:MAG: hypothetical protein EP334_08415 [Gammaproteobacteria bacterium]|nr:MAG: hypothetical protein EP334_08415 [Gammaproteobacteria bacterium]